MRHTFKNWILLALLLACVGVKAASPSFQQVTNIINQATNAPTGAANFGPLTSTSFDASGAATFRSSVRGSSVLSSNNLTALGTNIFLSTDGLIRYTKANTIEITNKFNVGIGAPNLQFLNVAGGVVKKGASIAQMYIGEYSAAAGTYACMAHTNVMANLDTAYSLLIDTAGTTYFNGPNLLFRTNNTGFIYANSVGTAFGSEVQGYFCPDFTATPRFRGLALWGGATGVTNASMSFSTTFNTFDINRFGLTNRMVGAIYGNSSQVVATNTASVVQLLGATSIGTTNIAASTFTAGKRFMSDSAGIYTTSLSGPTLTVELVYNGTVIATTGAVTPTSSVTDKGWHCVCSFTVHTTGASGTAFADGELMLKNTGVIGSELVADMSSSNTSFTFSTTTAAKIELRATWSANTAGNTFICRQASVWLVN